MTKRILSLMLAAVLTLAVLIPVATAEEISGAKEYYIYTNNTGKTLNVRSEPDGDIVGSLEQGTKVKLISFVSDTWAMISFTYDKPGSGVGEWPAYVSRRYLIDVEPSELSRLVEQERESYTGDPLTDMTAEFESAMMVPSYRVSIRPARASSWVPMRWVPCNIGPVIDMYLASDELIVLQEMDHYLQVQDPNTGDVGYIHKMFAARLQ